MHISNIDPDFEDIIKELDTNGFKPFASCDGVLKNHNTPSLVTNAYISFLDSSKILELMSALKKDDYFVISMSNCSDIEPYELYGNEIFGNSYSVSFENKHGEYTEYFKKIITGVEKGQITGIDKKLIMMRDMLNLQKDSDIYFRIEINSKCQEFMKKKDRMIKLTIDTKEGLEYEFDSDEISKIIANTFDIEFKNENDDFDSSEFIVSYLGAFCEIYSNDVDKMLEIIRYVNNIEKNLVHYEKPDEEYLKLEEQKDVCDAFER